MNLVYQIINIVAEKNSNISFKKGLFDAKEIKEGLLNSETPFATIENETIKFHSTKRAAETYARTNKCILATVEDNYLDYRKF